MVVTEMSLECDPPLMALAMYLAAGTIDWAAHETSKSREEILQEIERNFKSMIVPADAGPDETSPGRVATEDDTSTTLFVLHVAAGVVVPGGSAG
jgi:hypothetical protein